ncbi:MAG: permease-like cell division protein FtsX [Psychromonas sp.]|nr:permease-like cell division protein FtsX [Psychromonas sp.]
MSEESEKSKVLSGSPRITKISLIGQVSAFFRYNIHALFTSFSALWKTPFATCMTAAVLGIALSLPCVFNVIYKNIERGSAQWNGASEINLFLKKNMPEQQIQVLINKLALYDDIHLVTYISRHQALEEFKKMSGFSKSLNYLDENPFPAVLVVIPTEAGKNLAGNRLLVSKLKNEEGVDLVSVDIEWIAKLQAIVSLVVDVVIAISTLLLISVLLILSNTIRLNILNQRVKIEIFKLLGATNNYIQRPYLYAGAWYGFLGGLLAWLLTIVMVKWLQGGVSQLMSLYQIKYNILMMDAKDVVLLIIIAPLLGFVASYISVKQYLVKIEPK